MKFMLLIYTEDELLEKLPEGQFDSMMRHCLDHADELRAEGQLLDSQMLEDASTARSVRVRNGRQAVVDGPFTEAKEVLGGFNLVEAPDMETALRMAAEFPWTRTGRIEVRPVRDVGAVRRRVGAAASAHA